MRGKRRPPEERRSNKAGPLPPCRICGEAAAGFHYGVNTCEACKGFFRRSQNRAYEYVCMGSGNCPIGANRRKSCPKCRLERCLSFGMSKDAIKTGRYTYKKRNQDNLEIEVLERVKRETGLASTQLADIRDTSQLLSHSKSSGDNRVGNFLIQQEDSSITSAILSSGISTTDNAERGHAGASLLNTLPGLSLDTGTLKNYTDEFSEEDFGIPSTAEVAVDDYFYSNTTNSCRGRPHLAHLSEPLLPSPEQIPVTPLSSNMPTTVLGHVFPEPQLTCETPSSRSSLSISPLSGSHFSPHSLHDARTMSGFSPLECITPTFPGPSGSGARRMCYSLTLNEPPPMQPNFESTTNYLNHNKGRSGYCISTGNIDSVERRSECIVSPAVLSGDINDNILQRQSSNALSQDSRNGQKLVHRCLNETLSDAHSVLHHHERPNLYTNALVHSEKYVVPVEENNKQKYYHQHQHQHHQQNQYLQRRQQKPYPQQHQPLHFHHNHHNIVKQADMQRSKNNMLHYGREEEVFLRQQQQQQHQQKRHNPYQQHQQMFVRHQSTCDGQMDVFDNAWTFCSRKTNTLQRHPSPAPTYGITDQESVTLPSPNTSPVHDPFFLSASAGTNSFRHFQRRECVTPEVFPGENDSISCSQDAISPPHSSVPRIIPNTVKPKDGGVPENEPDQSVPQQPDTQETLSSGGIHGGPEPSETEYLVPPLQTWSPAPQIEYLEEEMDELVDSLIASHQRHLQDSNSLSDEFILKGLQESMKRVHLQDQVFSHPSNINQSAGKHNHTSTDLALDIGPEEYAVMADAFDTNIRHQISFIKTIPGFRDLSLESQKELVKASISELYFLSHYRGFLPDCPAMADMKQALCVHQLLMPYPEEITRELFKVALGLQELKLSFGTTVMLKVLCVFLTDRVEVEDRHQCEVLFEKYLQCFLHQLNRDFPDTHGLVMAKVTAVLSEMRILEAKCQKLWHTRVSQSEEMVGKPILVELFTYANDRGFCLPQHLRSFVR